MTRIAILTPSLSGADATGNDILGMAGILTSRGDEVRIFAGASTLPEPEVWDPQKLKRFLAHPSDLLVYHYASGWELGLDLLRAVNCQTATKYHNVTPPEFFERFSSDFARLCREGRDQLFAVAGAGCDLYLSDSSYNARELVAAGVHESKSLVVPPFHHVDRLHSTAPDLPTLNRYQDKNTNILMVGRIAPNKGHGALIEAFAAYHHAYNRNSRLIIVGKQETRLQIYNSALHELTRSLRVDHAVNFTGGVSDSVLKACYLSADVFLLTSEHEGFCVPLIEAMAMRVPIVAYGSSAIPETVGNAGIVWGDRNPYLLAESINRIVNDESISFALGLSGWQRYQQSFSNEKIAEIFLGALNGLL